MAVDLIERNRRVGIANAFIEIIANHGRQFFRLDRRISRFELDAAGRVWFVDKWTGSRIYCHQSGRWGHKFSEGGTLLDLCIALRNYIMGRAKLPLNHLGPWSKTLCGGDLWGYGDDMSKVREACHALAEEGPG